MPSYIPFIPSDNNYTLSVTLDGTPYLIDVHWNERAPSSQGGVWYMDLYAADRTPIAVGIAILLGAEINTQRRYISFFQENVLQVVDTSGSGVDAAFDELGGRIQVLFLTNAEMQSGAVSAPPPIGIT